MRGHLRFPIGRGGYISRGGDAPRASSNLIVIQTVPMDGESDRAPQCPAVQRLPVAQSQPTPTTSASLLRPQDRWSATATAAKPKSAYCIARLH